MKAIFARFLGVVLILAALAGVLLSAVAIFITWQVKNPIITEIRSYLDLSLSALDTTRDGVATVSQSLDTAEKSIANIDGTVQNVSATLSNSTHFVDTAANLFGTILPDTIVSTQEAINSASVSAKMMDDTLTSLKNVPLLGSFFDAYQPKVPLNKALFNISVKLTDLPTAFKGMQDDFQQIKGEMDDVRKRLDDTHTQISQIQDSLKKAKEVVIKYQSLEESLRPRLTKLRDSLPRAVTALVLAITAFFAWLAFSQLGLLLQGLNLIFGRVLLINAPKG